MKLEQFYVAFRNVLWKEVKEEKTAGGIFIPSSDFINQDDKVYEVIKLGSKCEELILGDLVYLTPGIRISKRRIEQVDYVVVYEQQVEGGYRHAKEAKIEDFVVPEPELTEELK